MIQKIVFINKLGQPIEMIVKVIKKLSKTIVVKRPEDDALITIPRKAVESITEITADDLPDKVKCAD